QAGDDLVLKRMKRRHARSDAIRFCREVRRLRPDAVFGADLIAGFPTATGDQVPCPPDLVAECGLAPHRPGAARRQIAGPRLRPPPAEPVQRQARSPLRMCSGAGASATTGGFFG
ncbi:tRNA (N(6)-L-threonylcarbamoyladenosine(37)-C(2))-methylthiotransferase MtaB, partial [Methylobacterium sp. E-016]|nr:tRNA (N(6)-L-threonylcarbamoyladenosine(37)-C(2))-methylthiotransferase MtaB [Methylobacterium sp. E-016]